MKLARTKSTKVTELTTKQYREFRALLADPETAEIVRLMFISGYEVKTTQEAKRKMKMLTALILARDAIVKHRDSIIGSVNPESQLYKVLPILDARITKAKGKPKTATIKTSADTSKKVSIKCSCKDPDATWCKLHGNTEAC